MSLKVKSNGINFNVPTVEDFPTEYLEEALVCVVTDENRGGTFVYREANALVNNGGTIFNGWTRQYNGEVNLKWFGAVGDGITNDTLAIQSAINYSSLNKIKLNINSGNYKITSGLKTKSNLYMSFSNDSWILPYGWSDVGAILTNVSLPTDSTDLIQSNITIENPQIDGQYLPCDLASNDNAIGFARGASKVRVIGGYIKNFAFSYTVGGAGGKGVNFEQGVVDGLVDGTIIENCGVGVFVQGTDGTSTNGATKATTRIIINNIITENCEASIAVLGINQTVDPDGDPNDQLVIIDNVTFHNCGHMPNRPATSSFEKSGVIVIGEGQNVRISNVKGSNDVGYPTSYPSGDYVGNGLSGPIGAVIWGWGRNISISNVEYHGDCDALIQINRARAIGDDASADGIIKNVFKFHVDNLKHYGTANYVVNMQASPFTPTNANVEANFINIYPDTITTGFVSSVLNGFTNINLELIDSKVGSVKNIVRGDANSLIDSRNTFASLGTGSVVLAVDSGYEFGTFTPSLGDAPTGNLATQAVAIGRYTKHGRRVFFEINLVNIVTTGLTAGNQIHILGLPYISSNYYSLAVVPHKVAGSLVTQTTGIFASIVAGESYMKLYNETTTGYGDLLVSSITSGTGDVFISGSYEVVF